MKEFTRTYSVIHLDSIYKNIEEAKKRDVFKFRCST
mgnify:CR=1 FL=1